MTKTPIEPQARVLIARALRAWIEAVKDNKDWDSVLQTGKTKVCIAELTPDTRIRVIYGSQQTRINIFLRNNEDQSTRS